MNLALAKYYSAANAITFSIILAALFVTRKIIVFTNKSKLFKLATKNVSNVIKLIKQSIVHIKTAEKLIILNLKMKYYRVAHEKNVNKKLYQPSANFANQLILTKTPKWTL